MDEIKKYLEKFNQNGFVIIPNILPQNITQQLRQELCCAMDEDLEQYANVFDKGMVHNLMARGSCLAQVLEHRLMNDFVSLLLSDTHILYAYQSSSLLPGEGNYGTRMHVDSPRFIGGYCTNVGVIFPLDDFTEENGATYMLPRSHKKENCDFDQFNLNSIRAVCGKGDMIIFHGRAWHRAGINNTNHARHSITLNFCRSYMRQRFDFPKLLSSQLINSLGEQGKKLIGMNVRMPASMSEFYLPEEQRLYKANQG